MIVALLNQKGGVGKTTLAPGGLAAAEIAALAAEVETLAL